jgi:hypothetical protein
MQERPLREPSPIVDLIYFPSPSTIMTKRNREQGVTLADATIWRVGLGRDNVHKDIKEG